MPGKSLLVRILTAVLLLAITSELVLASSGSVLSSRQFPGPLVVTPSFSFSPTNPGVGQVITFTGSATGGTPPYSFTWNFGDGGSASGSIVKHIFISLQTFTVAVTVIDSVGGTNSFQNPVYLGSLNTKVNCTPAIARILQITANQTQSASFSASAFSPGITTTVSGGVAKRWLTPGPTPSGWHSPGPSCIITNNLGNPISVYVEVDGVKRASITTEDSASNYDATNGGGSMGGTFSDSTMNIFDPAIVPNYGSSCTSASDPTCYGRIHIEFDHDWKAAGYCGTGTACDPNALSSQTTAASTLIDFQGFVYWDPGNLNAQDHSFSGWELHPLTGWRVHQDPLTVSISSSPSSPAAGQSVTFTGTASGGTAPYTFTWDFGDGTTVTGNPATHSYSAGSYSVHLSVVDSNSATGVVSKTVTVSGGSSPDFSISSNPSSLSFQIGSSEASTVSLASLNSFSGTVTLSASVSPSGLIASLSPTSVTLSSGGTGSSNLSVSSSTAGNHTVTVTGTSGSLSHSTTVTVSVVAPDFSIASNPASLWIQSGSSSTTTVQLDSLNGFSGSVALSTSVSRLGLTASLTPTSVTLSSGGTASSTLSLSSSTAGIYSVAVTGISGSLSHSATVTITGVSSLLASDAAVGPSSLGTSGGEKLIQDPVGRMIAVYVDSSGRVGLAYANSDPMVAGWSAPVKSSTPTSPYARPAAVLVSLSSLRLIVEGGSSSGVITDIPVAVQRDSQNNITGFVFGAPVVIDSSGLARYPTAVLAHNGDILLAWSWQNSTRTMVKSLRWDASIGWTNLAGSSSLPDIALLDSSSITWFISNIIERPDNNNVYLLGNRLSGPPSTLAYNKASWNGSSWSWGVQNLTFESNSSSGVEDPVGFAWDPVASLMVVSYGITGTQSFGVFTLNLLDQKTHLDTPSLAITERDWGTVSVHATTGDYYLFLMNVNTDGGRGTLGFIRHTAGGSWNSTLTLFDSASDNRGLDLRVSGTSPSLDMLYAEGASAPAKVKFVRLNPFNPPNFSLAATPSSVTVQAGSSGASTVTLTSLYSFTGAVTLSTTVSPSGLTASLSPASVTLTGGGTAASTLTVNSTKPGTYTIIVQGIGGSLLHSITVTVTVTDVGPTVSFIESATTVPTGTAITLTISASDLDGTVSSLKVVWGDGTIDNLAGTSTSDSHSYALAGSYTVYVNATDNANLTMKSSTSVKTITDRPPTVSFTESATTAPTGTSVTLTITASDPDGTVSGVKVVWGDGTIDSLAGSATSDSHAYSVAGSYQVYVNATDNSSSVTKSSIATKTITDRPPTVSFTESATTAPTGTSITLTMAAADPDGTIASLKVSWGDGTVDTLAGSAISDSHAYSVAGTYQAYVNATDNSGSTTKSSVATKTITDRPPTVSFSESATTAPTGTGISLTIAAADPDGAISNLKVVWGDGTIDDLAGSSTSDTHSYALAGSYTVYVNATDNASLTTKSNVAVKTITDRPPTVSFSESATIVPTGTSITLAISASDPDGSVASMKVSWGDGTVDSIAGTATSDSHSYALAGSYTVYVNATDNASLAMKSSTATKTITGRPPAVSFVESATTVPTGTTITLTITASDPDGTVTGLNVSWGDGTIDSLPGTAASNNHSYALAGLYTVYVNATDNANLTTKSTSATKTITERPPVISFTESATTVPSGTTITLTITSTDPDGTVTNIEVAWGDGTVDSLAGTATSDSHSYALSGSYNVYINATDNANLTTKSAVAVKTISDRAPTVTFTESATTVPTGASITLSISASDPDGTVSSLKVSWGDGTVDTLTGSATTDSHAYSVANNYSVYVNATDNSGSITKSSVATKTITDRSPTVSFTESATTVPTGTLITLTISASDSDGTIAAVRVVWGDGTVDTLAGTATADSHSYSLAGSYSVYVNATDNAGLTTQSSTGTKTIMDLPPIVSFTESATTAPTGTPITLDISSADPDGVVTSIKVVWGDGTVNNLAGTATNDSHAYALAGSYTVYVNATDNVNLTTKSSVAMKTITDRVPTVTFTESATTVPTGTSIILTISASDPDGSVTSIKIVWGDGTIDTLAGNATSDSHKYASTGIAPSATFSVYVNATDNSGSTTQSSIATKTITDTAPTVSFTESTTTATTGQTITLTVTSSDPDGLVGSLTVVWGDGTVDTLAGTATSDSHSYSVAGSYQVYVNATDNSGSATESTTATKTITDRPPAVSFTESATMIPTGTTVTLTITSVDPDGTVSTIKVSWGDGTVDSLPGTATSDAHSYALAGSYTIYVNATDDAGLTTKSAAATKTVTDRPPTVTFSESTTTAPTGTSIALNITSYDPDGSITSLRVFWGDGTIDNLPETATSISHSYSIAGSYTVYVNATDNADLTVKSTIATKTITDRPPVVSFTESATTVPTGTSITLTITSSDPDGTVSSLKVSWGDGTVDNLPDTATSDSHAYSVAGSYAVYINATDNAGQTMKSSTATKTINDRPPVISFTESTTTAPTGASITLTIYASDPDGTISVLEVVWGDGIIDSLPGTATGDSHSYARAGSYTVYLNATDTSGLTTKSNLATKTITDRPPVVSFTESATTIPTGSPITLTINASDPDGTVTGIRVVWGDGTIDTLSGNATTDSHSYPQAGSYGLHVNATDNGDLTTRSSPAVKTITDRPPTVSFTESATTATAGQTLTLVILSGDPDGTIITTVVNWGDGTMGIFSGPQSSDSHAYSSTGNASTAAFTVTVTVTDDSGNMAVATAVKTVQDLPPIAAFTFTPSSPVAGQLISFDGASSSDPDGLIISYQWSFGDGGISLVPQTSHAYSSAGNYTVTLAVTDDSGSTGTATTVLNVGLELVPPSWPSNEQLRIYFVHPSNNATSLGLSWAPPAIDDGGIALYEIYINGVLNATVPGSTTSYMISGLKPGSYTFKIEAVDYGGLTSTGGPTASIRVSQGSGSLGSRFAT